MQRWVASRICFGPVVQMAISTLGLLCVGSDACAVDQPSIPGPTILRKMWFINVSLNLLINVGSMKVIPYPTKLRLQIKCGDFDCNFAKWRSEKMLWEQLGDLQSHSAKYHTVYHLSLLIQPFCWNPRYSTLIRSSLWLSMPWFFESPGHQQPWYWIQV